MKAVSTRVRPAIYVAAIAAFALIAPEYGRTVLAATSSVVLEALPYFVAGRAAVSLLGRFRGLVGYAGCGCGSGPGARSIPVTYATAALFGFPIAVTRWLAAAAVSRLHSPRETTHAHASVLADLAQLAPGALACGLAVTFAPSLSSSHYHPVLQLALGAFIGFFATPCTLGGVALAATFRATSPLLATGILCVSGICDRNVWFPHAHARIDPDRTLYLMLAAACCIVAAAHGASLVHPRLTIPLAVCSAYFVFAAMRAPSRRLNGRHALAALLLAACVIGSPPPPDTATEATVDDGYAGERIDFTGRYEESGGGISHVIRYAITCCRADARPVGIRLATTNPAYRRQWVRVRGTLHESDAGLIVGNAAVERVAPPVDPFVYR